MEAAGIERFLDRRAIRVADEAQDSAGRGGHQFRSAPVRARRRSCRTCVTDTWISRGFAASSLARVRPISSIRASPTCSIKKSAAATRATSGAVSQLSTARRRGRAGIARVRYRQRLAMPVRADHRAPSRSHLQSRQRNPSIASAQRSSTFQGWRVSSSAGMSLLAQVAHLARDLPWQRLVLFDQPEHHGIGAERAGRIEDVQWPSSRIAHTGLRHA